MLKASIVYYMEEENGEKKKLALFVVILYCDDLSSCGSDTAQNGGSIQRLDGEGINYTNVLSC